MASQVYFDIGAWLKDHRLPAFKKAWESPKRFIVLKGGGGSGKSHAIAQKIIIETMFSPERMLTLVVRKNNIDNKESTFSELKKRMYDLGVEEFWKINSTTMEMTFSQNGNRIIFRGLDDIERIKSISGISKIWVEEASQITQDEFNQLNVRLGRQALQTYTPQIFLTFNPIAATHWLKKRFFDNPDKDAFVCETNYLDNKFLPQANINELEKFKFTSPYYYQVYCLGNWGTVGDTLFNREKIGQQMDEIFTKKFKKGRFKFEYEAQMIVDESIDFIEDKNGEITIYTECDDMMPYVLGADTAGFGIDNFAVHVVNNYDGKIVAQYHGKVSEKDFTDQLYCLGKWYNEGMINVETNFSTYVVNELERLQYPILYRREVIGTNDNSMVTNRYGFVTTKSNRTTMLSEVDKYLTEHMDDVMSLELLDELSSFVVIETNPRGRQTKMRAEAAQGAHDDLVMALGITLMTREQWDSQPKESRKPEWKRDAFDPFDWYKNEGDNFTIW